MKQILLVLCFVSLLAACSKQVDTVVSGRNEEAARLMSITTSNGDDTNVLNLSYHYSGNQVTDIYRLFKNNRIDSSHFAHLDYPEDNHIRVTDPNGRLSEVNYFLTGSKLPLQISKTGYFSNTTYCVTGRRNHPLSVPGRNKHIRLNKR